MRKMETDSHVFRQAERWRERGRWRVVDTLSGNAGWRNNTVKRKMRGGGRKAGATPGK